MNMFETIDTERNPDWAEQTLRQAIRVGELSIHYQPIMDIRSDDAAPIQAEALFRWSHPVHGVMAPTDSADFAAFQSLMIQATDCVFKLAVEQLSAWRRDQLGISMAVNLAAELLEDSDLPGRLGQLTEQGALQPRDVCLEFRQSELTGLTAKSRETAATLSSMGFCLVLDNVGRGPVPLDALLILPWSAMKIDHCLIRQMDRNVRARNVVGSLIRMAHDLEMSVCAHGVERQETLKLLKAQGCDHAQGWYFGKAMPAAALANALLSG